MKFKEEGNVLFKANSPAEAKDMYTKGMFSLLDNVPKGALNKKEWHIISEYNIKNFF